MSPLHYVGVDGDKRGWVCVVVDDRGFLDSEHFADFASVMKHYRSAKTIGVDMPIGFVDARREADQAARDRLPGRASSVFNAPPRAALEASSYREACDISLRLTDRKLSQQSYNLFDKIREVDAFVRRRKLHEVHPELSFALMGDGPVALPKKSWGGMRERLRRLADEGIELPASLGAADRAGIDDVIDAAAAAWSARRIARGEGVWVPDRPTQRDASGRKIAIRA